jgi:serine/threonine-protein kinase
MASTQPPPVAKEDPYIGKTIDGRYVVEAILGQGGMGVVYRAKHKMIDKKVAIKVLRADMARDREVTERFLQEAKAASAIGNPHIVDISDFGQLPDGCTYFVMEYLAGKSLTKLMDETKPVPVKRLIRIAKQAGEALAAAHNAGIIHRDLKPDNIMLIDRGSERDFLKILDFGIAKVSSAESTGSTARLTKAGAVFGTPHYMSPEQAAGSPIAKQTDIYSLGVILYEMAAGKPPFDADNFMGVLTAHMYKQPVPIRAIVPPPQEVPAGLDMMIMKCLSKKPELRYASMEALVSDFEKFERGEVPDAVGEMMGRSGAFSVPADYFRPSHMPPSVPGTPNERRKPWPLYAGIAGVAVVVLIATAVLISGATTKADTGPKPVATKEPPVQSAPTQTPTPATVSQGTGVTKMDLPATLHPVAVAVDPADAKITRDGTELKPPVLLELKDGETASLAVSRAGFVAQTVTIDSSESSKLIKLVPAAGPKPTNTTKPTGGGGGGEFGDPWKKH